MATGVDHDGEHYRVHAQLLPGSAQSPRPKFWMAAKAPHPHPLARSFRWDGVAPISGEAEQLTPAQLADYVAGHPASGSTGAAFDIVATRDTDHSVEDYLAAGATWVIDSVWPIGDWMAELANSPASESQPSPNFRSSGRHSRLFRRRTANPFSCRSHAGPSRPLERNLGRGARARASYRVSWAGPGLAFGHGSHRASYPGIGKPWIRNTRVRRPSFRSSI